MPLWKKESLNLKADRPLYNMYAAAQIFIALSGAFLAQVAIYQYVGNQLLFSNHIVVGLEIILIYFLSGKFLRFLLVYEPNQKTKKRSKSRKGKSGKVINLAEERKKRDQRRKHLRKTLGENASRGNWSVLLKDSDKNKLEMMKALLGQYEIESFIADRPVYSVLPGVGGEGRRILVKTEDMPRARRIMRQHNMEISNV